MPLSWTETLALLNKLRGLPTVYPLTLGTHEAGLQLTQRYGFSGYNAMEVASALQAGNKALWSEDTQDSMTLPEGLHIIHLFGTAS